MKLQVKVAIVVFGALALTFAGVGLAAPSGSSDLRISKSDSPDPVGLGSTLTYTIQVDNLGPDAATGVTVTDQLPKGVDLVSTVSSLGQCASKGRKVTCELGTLGTPTVDYGGPVTVTLTVIPRRLGTITNTASVKSNQKDPVAGSNKTTVTTRVVGPPLSCRGVVATIVGTAADNTLVGSGGRDVIAALGGNDYVGAGSAADRVLGGVGSDRLVGHGGPDLLKGGAGNDALKGNRGDDRLYGGPNLDRCFGGPGIDSIRGCDRTFLKEDS
jgi:uncharacterized repeat protein (TIGR01451 family)